MTSEGPDKIDNYFSHRQHRRQDARRDVRAHAKRRLISSRRGGNSLRKRRDSDPSALLVAAGGWVPMGGLSARVQLHFIPGRRSAGTPHLPLYHLVSPWAARAIDLLEVEGTRRRTLPARSSRYARVCRARLRLRSLGLVPSNGFRAVMTELSSPLPNRLSGRGRDR